MTFSQHLISAVRNELYPLGRWGDIQFPPDVAGKEIIVKASVVKDESRPFKGLIMAHGGKENGYGIFIQDGKIHMVVKQNGKTYTARSPQALPKKFDMTAQLT